MKKKMEGKELMVYDLVELNTGYGYVVRRVNCAERKTAGVMDEKDVVHYNVIGLLRPIPLTEYIMNANGFQKRKDGLYQNINADVMTLDGSPILFGIDATYKGVAMANEEWQSADVVFYVENVHEMQHALRLIGRRDMADKFKLPAKRKA